MVLRKPCCYKLISRYLENVFYHCSCRCTYVFPGYFQVNLIFTKRSGSSPGLYLPVSALYLPAFHTAAQVYTCQWGEFVLIISVTGFKVHRDWHRPDKLLPSSHLIQSCSSKVLPISATVWFSPADQGTCAVTPSHVLAMDSAPRATQAAAPLALLNCLYIFQSCTKDREYTIVVWGHFFLPN